MDQNIGELGFWLMVGIVVAAMIWSSAKKDQRKHELTLKLLEKGQTVDEALLAKLLAADKTEAAQKSVAEKRRDDSGVGGFLFLVAGIVLVGIGMIGGRELLPVEGTAPGPGGVPAMMFQDTGPSWPLIGLGVFCFLFGNWIFYAAKKEYLQAKAEEKAEAEARKD